MENDSKKNIKVNQSKNDNTKSPINMSKSITKEKTVVPKDANKSQRFNKTEISKLLNNTQINPDDLNISKKSRIKKTLKNDIIIPDFISLNRDATLTTINCIDPYYRTRSKFLENNMNFSIDLPIITKNLKEIEESPVFFKKDEIKIKLNEEEQLKLTDDNKKIFNSVGNKVKKNCIKKKNEDKNLEYIKTLLLIKDYDKIKNKAEYMERASDIKENYSSYVFNFISDYINENK